MSENTEEQMLSRFNGLIAVVTPMGGKYTPPSPFSAIAHMQTQATAGQAALDALDTREAEEKAERNARQLIYADIAKDGSDVYQWCKSAGWTDRDLADLQSTIREMRGKPSQAREDDPNTPDVDESRTGGSASQTSYASLEGHWSEMVALLIEKSYDSREEGFTLADLTAKRDLMRTANLAVTNADGATAAARQLRDEIFYTNDGSIVESAGLSKSYLRSMHGDSQAWQTVKDYEFQTPKRLRR